MAATIPDRWPAPSRSGFGRGLTVLGSVGVHALAAAAILLAPLLAAPADPLSPGAVGPVTMEIVMEGQDLAAPSALAPVRPGEPDQATDPEPSTPADTAVPPPETILAADARPDPPPETPSEPEPPVLRTMVPERPPEPPPEPNPPEPPPPEPTRPEEPAEPAPGPPPEPRPEPPVDQPAAPEVSEPPPLPPPPPPKPEPPKSPTPAPAARAAPSRAIAAGPARKAANPAANPAPAAVSAAAEAAPAPPRISASWHAAIAAWLHRHKSYPAAARARGEQGSCHVRFTVARDGTVLAVHLTGGTGSPILDQAVRTLLTGARVPAFPADMAHEQVTVQVRIDYRLDR